tara:strand:+ start:61 stop:417 length:357 start_codon:yes stop_codon:yes gene_type:complete
MLVSMNAMRIYEMVAHYAKTKEKFVLLIDNTHYFTLSDTKKTEVREFYDDSIPVDEIGEVFDNKYTFYEFSSQAVATEIATDWFPQTTDLEDQDYFIEVQVITPSGGIPYTSLRLTKE